MPPYCEEHSCWYSTDPVKGHTFCRKCQEEQEGKRATVYTVEPGRHIHVNGQAFISITRQGDTNPTTADEMTHLICRLLNRYLECGEETF